MAQSLASITSPHIERIAPAAAIPGGEVTIYGRNFGSGNHVRPAVRFGEAPADVLFHSAARLQGVPMVAAILTGMGQDGADGLLALRKAGAETFAEDEQSCVVFGMPKEAIARGAACHVVTLFQMPQAILDSVDRVPVGAR